MKIRRLLVFLGVLMTSLLTAAVAFAEEEAGAGGRR